MYLMELGTKADNEKTYTYWRKAYDQGFPAAVPLIEYKELKDHTGLFSAIKMASSVDETIEYIKWVQEEGKNFLVQKEEIDILPGMKWYYTQSQRGFNYALGMMGFSLIREGSVKEAIDVISQFEKESNRFFHIFFVEKETDCRQSLSLIFTHVTSFYKENL